MNLSQHTSAAALLRLQFQALDNVMAPMSIGDDRQRRILLIAPQEWPQWLGFLHNGPLPAQPAVPTMLRRLAAATFRLASLAERHVL